MGECLVNRQNGWEIGGKWLRTREHARQGNKHKRTRHRTTTRLDSRQADLSPTTGADNGGNVSNVLSPADSLDLLPQGCRSSSRTRSPGFYVLPYLTSDRRQWWPSSIAGEIILKYFRFWLDV